MVKCLCVSTLNDEVKKITYELEILKQAEFMCLNSFGYLGSEVLSKNIENPINYRVFVLSIICLSLIW